MKITLNIRVEMEADVVDPNGVMRAFQYDLEMRHRTGYIQINSADIHMTVHNPTSSKTHWNGEEWTVDE